MTCATCEELGYKCEECIIDYSLADIYICPEAIADIKYWGWNMPYDSPKKECIYCVEDQTCRSCADNE